LSTWGDSVAADLGVHGDDVCAGAGHGEVVALGGNAELDTTLYQQQLDTGPNLEEHVVERSEVCGVRRAIQPEQPRDGRETAQQLHDMSEMT
jgi:hypothetical protein